MNQHSNLAFFLLFIGFFRNYGWVIADPSSAGVASKALGAVAAICMISIIAYNFASKMVLLVAAFYIFEELQTAACSIMYLVEPWHVEAGQSMCSSRLGFDLGAVGLFVVGLIAYKLVHSNGTE